MNSEKRLGLLVGMCIVVMLILIVPRLQGVRNGVSEQDHDNGHLRQSPVAFDPPSFDFGTIFQAEIISHTFKLFNRSSNELRIVAMHAGCSCTILATNMLGKVLQPQSEALIQVSFDSGSRAGPTDSTFDVALQAGTVRYVVQAKLYGRVISDFSYEPRTVNFGQLRPGDVAEQSVVFRPEALTQFDLVTTQFWGGPFEVSVKQRIVIIRVHTPQISRRETVSQSVRIVTSSRRMPEVTIPVSGMFIPDIEISPQEIFLTPNEVDRESHFTVLTRQPSRIKRILKISPDGTSDLELSKHEKEGETSRWGACLHSFRLINSELNGTERMDVELEIQNGTGQPEARSVSVRMMSLTKQN